MKLFATIVYWLLVFLFVVLLLTIGILFGWLIISSVLANQEIRELTVHVIGMLFFVFALTRILEWAQKRKDLP